MTTVADLESLLRTWSRPANDRQTERANHTADLIRKALSSYQPIPNSMMKVAAQGSKFNNTDTVDESDVDIRVEFHSDRSQPNQVPPIFFPKKAGLAAKLTDESLSLKSASFGIETESFKDHVEHALREQFGSTNVDRHDKCIKVKESRLTFPCDIVACFPHRLFLDQTRWEPGIAIVTDSNQRIYNYPVQHHTMGVRKNDNTERLFKRMVRCLKRMENLLVKSDAIPSGAADDMGLRLGL